MTCERDAFIAVQHCCSTSSRLFAAEFGKTIPIVSSVLHNAAAGPQNSSFDKCVLCFDIGQFTPAAAGFWATRPPRLWSYLPRNRGLQANTRPGVPIRASCAEKKCTRQRASDKDGESVITTLSRSVGANQLLSPRTQGQGETHPQAAQVPRVVNKQTQLGTLALLYLYSYF